MSYIKKTGLFLLLVCGFAFSIKSDYARVISSDINTTIIEFEMDDFQLAPVQTDRGNMYLAKFKDGASLLKQGAPDIYKYSRSVIIPDDTRMQFEILSSEYRDYENILIAPSKGNLSRKVNPNNVPYVFGIEYDQNAFFPHSLAMLQTPYILRDLRGQTIDFHPIQYNPVTKVLRIYHQMKIKVYSNGESSTNILHRKSAEKYMSREYKNIYEGHFLNFNNDNRFNYLDDHGNMLIISYASFMGEMQPLVDWKSRKGLRTEMINVADIGSNSTAIENFVNNYYNENGLTFLLLVGDIAQIPSPSIGGSASDPSYGFIEGNDSYAEVIVGRFSGSTPAHIATQVERTIEYERSPQSGADWYDNALGIASNQGPGFGGYTDDEFNNFMWETVLSDFTYDSYEDIYDGSGGTLTQGINAINNGVSLINYTGHGSISSWGNGAPLNTSNVNSLTNDNLLPFVITVGCNVGEFQSTNECFCESWLRATNGGEPTGAIGHMGSTISQSWEPPMHGQYGMNLILTESYEGHITRSQGGIATNGCLYMNDAQGASGINETNYWTLFGDPSLELRTDEPIAINVSHDGTIIVGQTEMIVNTGVNNALVAISKDNELLAYGYSEMGSVTINLEGVDLLPGDYDLVVTSFNAFPYEAMVSVITPDGPYVTLESFEIISDNNNNGMADFDETISLELQANNVGVDDAHNVIGVVSIDDLYISLGNNSIEFGDIAAGGSSSAGNIEFTSAHNVPDGYSAGFTILFSNDEDQWEGNFYVIIHAPILTVSNPSFTDAGGDGVWDTGETINVVLLLNNEGSADHMMYPGVHLTEYSDDASIAEGMEYYWLYGISAGTSVPVEFPVTASASTNMGTEVTFTAYASEMVCEENCIESEHISFTFTIGLPIDDSLYEPLNLIAEAGENSIDLSWDEPFECPDGQFADCDSQCIDAWYEAWIGDEICDDGGWGVNFYCEEFDFDGGDCDGRENIPTTDDTTNMDPSRLNADFSDAIMLPLNERDVEGYFIYRDDSYIAFTDELEYSDNDISAGSEYCYHITAVYEEGQSGPSNTACAIAEGNPGLLGDVNEDGITDVLDLILVVNMILGTMTPDFSLADLNNDGIINIQDVIVLVNVVIGGRTIHSDENIGAKVQIHQIGSSVSISSNGKIAGVQMTLKHDTDFTIDLTDKALISDYRTIDNEETTLIIVEPESDELFSFTGDYTITYVIAANVLSQAMEIELITNSLPDFFELSQNYPNPFNPYTRIQFSLESEELVSLNIYDIQGRMVHSLINNVVFSSGYHQINWDGKNNMGTLAPSGMYFYKLISKHQTVTKKMIMMK